MKNTAFHDPQSIGCFDISTTQVGQLLTFEALDDPIIAAAKAVAHYRGQVIRTYDSGNGGLSISGDNMEAVLSINGSTFADYIGKKISFEVVLYRVGDVEITFDLLVVKSHL